MIEVIMRSGAELIEVECPAPIRNGKAELVLFVALSMQRQKASRRIDCSQDAGRNRIERRSLVIAAVCRTQYPMQPRDLNRCSEPRAAGSFGHQSGEARETNTRI